MFESLQERFGTFFRNLSGKGKISEANVRNAMRDVRTALLEADVHFDVVNKFVADVTEKAVGTEVLASIEPGQQMIKIVYDQLVNLMGPVDTRLYFVEPGPTILMMCGLQGSGKTTTCGKLAMYLKSKGKNPLLVACDLQRPAAVDQLTTLAEQVGVAIYKEPGNVGEGANPVQVAKNSVGFARANGKDVIILDTAGRLHIDQPLMDELRAINAQVKPHQIFLVVDAMVGQDAVNSAKAFNEQLELDGVILTKFDSDTRGGAALSVRAVTGKPIKFLGVGEKLQALEEFHPDRIAQRMLGMGDILTLVEKAQSEFDETKARKLQEKMAKAQFTLEDFLEQMQSVRKMGPMKQLLGMLPGVGQMLKDIQIPEEELNKTEAIIKSMTKQEREDPESMDGSRRRRIARGSGTQAEDVSRLIKGFVQAREMARKMTGLSMGSRMKMAQAMTQFDLGKLGAGLPRGALGGGGQKQSRLTPEQKRKLRDKRRRGK